MKGKNQKTLNFKLLIKFIKFFLLWVSSNLSIPFWIVGHIHLSLNVYDDISELWASIGMNLIVGIGFYLSWLEYNK
jgi:hypothetical protein